MRGPFRGIFLRRLELLRVSHALGRAAASVPDFDKLVRTLYRKRWVVYAKRPFGGADAVFAYLGRYTHRVGISDHRLISITDDLVTFRTRGDGQVSVSPESFIARLLQHILPDGFHKIRHLGLYAGGGGSTERLDRIRALLPRAKGKADRPVKERDSLAPEPTWIELLRILTGRDLRVCPACHSAVLSQVPLRLGMAIEDTS